MTGDYPLAQTPDDLPDDSPANNRYAPPTFPTRLSAHE
jgi:hypothetical protein